MKTAFDFSVAVLMVSQTSVLDTLVNKLYCDLKAALKIQNSFRLMTIRKASISEISEDCYLLKTWMKENLILYIGNHPGVYQNNFSEDAMLKIKADGPNLANLLFENHEDSSKRFNCFFNGSSLVYQIPWSLTCYEDSIKTKLPLLLSAIFEAKTMNVDCDFHLENPKCGFLQKSVVTFINPAHRPRSSPYAMISVKEAVRHVLKETYTLSKEQKKLKDCFNFVLAEDVKAPEPYPPFDASIKDGYAVIASDPAFEGSPPFILSVVGNAETGHTPKFEVIHGTCARVSTGGVIPASADAVVQVEDTRVRSSHESDEISIEFLKRPSKLQDIRVQGSDVSKESVIIPARQIIKAAEVGVLSIFGISSVLVYEKPWIALISTGDEIIEPESPILPGCIRDSNKSTLSHMLMENHIFFVDVGIAKDNPDIMKSHLMLALNSADIIISTGGVSMGEKDIMKQVLKKDFNATIHFGRVHMKPGKPTTFSTVEFNGRKKLIFSLPGNPVSACVCFYLFVMPCIRKMMGYEDPEHKVIKVKLGKDLKLDERPEFCRVSIKCDAGGVFVSETTGNQISSRLLSMQNADALLVLPSRSEELQILPAGSLVDAIVLKSI